jgi:hypothetical protein
MEGGWPEVAAVTVFAVTDTLGRLTGVRASSLVCWPGRDPAGRGRWGLRPVGAGSLVCFTVIPH